MLGRDRPQRFPARASESRGDRTLLAGWFSWPGWGATAGDLIARDLLVGWLRDAGHHVDVANSPPFDGGVDWRRVDPGDYDHVVFVCGPFPRSDATRRFLEHFDGARLVGVNLTMIESLDAWQPFDLLWERDSTVRVRPDVTFLAEAHRVPVLGICLVEPQREHSDPMHAVADAAVERLARSREAAIVRIDTRLDTGTNPLRTPAEVEALIARVDVLITTRLHGTVLAIKNGVPPLVIDPIGGGAKVEAQAAALGWPRRFKVDRLDEDELSDALDWCLTEEGRNTALACREGALTQLAGLREEVIGALRR